MNLIFMMLLMKNGVVYYRVGGNRMVKNLLIGIIVSGMVATGGLHVSVMETWNAEPIRDIKTGVEYSVLHDTTGNNWLIEKKLKKNVKYIVVTDDMSTSSIYDDKIIKVVEIS